MPRDSMTPKQARFVEEYLIDLNATAAASRAGYSDGAYGRQLITFPNVAAAIKLAQADLCERVNVTQEWVLARLVENVDRAMQAEPVKDRQGQETGEYVYNGSVANKALELLGKHCGMFVERTEGSVYSFNPHDFSRGGLKRVAAGESPQHVLATGGGRDG